MAFVDRSDSLSLKDLRLMGTWLPSSVFILPKFRLEIILVPSILGKVYCDFKYQGIIFLK